jgi:magnesium-protoporphyrin O-methyltransferase
VILPGVGGCAGDGIPGCERVFDRRTAESDLRDLRRDGPPWATRTLIEAFGAGLDLTDLTVIDVGAGVGSVHLELLARGARSAVDVDGSSAYLEIARDEAERQGVGERVRHFLGDLTALRPDLEPADIVSLDRVICCYGALTALLDAATSLALRRIGLVYPRDDWWVRAAVAVSNPLLFRGSAGYRMHVHRVESVAGALRSAGFAPLTMRLGRVWRVECWERTSAAGR